MRQRPSSAMRGILVLSGLLCLVLACREATAPQLPVTAVQVTPPPRVALWWRLTQTCSGIPGNPPSVSWYIVPNTSTLTYQGRQVYAYWLGDPDRIVLSETYANSGPIVRHEMLHALLHRPGHPKEAYLTSCGGVVACDAACIADAGGIASPPAAAPELQPRDVGTRFDVFAPPSAEALDTVPIAVMVTVTNPRPEPVWVKLAPRESGDLVHFTFGIIVDYDDPARIATLDSEEQGTDRFPLNVGESRRWVWDRTLSRGRYGIRGYFNVDTTARQVISLGQ